jgi:hypothetical protein
MDDFVQVQEFIAFRRGFQERGFVKLFWGHVWDYALLVAGQGTGL